MICCVEDVSRQYSIQVFVDINHFIYLDLQRGREESRAEILEKHVVW